MKNSHITKDKNVFMNYAGRMWGFLSCFACLTEAFNSINTVDQYRGTNWLQSYIHILCSNFGNKNLGIISIPCIGAGVYSIVSNYDSSRVDGFSYRKMLDFAIDNGFNRSQLDKLFIWRICFIAKRSVIKEKASGVKKTNIWNLVKLTIRYPYAWFNLYPFVFAPKLLCKLVVKWNERNKYSEKLHLNRNGDVIG